ISRATGHGACGYLRSAQDRASYLIPIGQKELDRRPRRITRKAINSQQIEKSNEIFLGSLVQPVQEDLHQFAEEKCQNVAGIVSRAPSPLWRVEITQARQWPCRVAKNLAQHLRRSARIDQWGVYCHLQPAKPFTKNG